MTQENIIEGEIEAIYRQKPDGSPKLTKLGKPFVAFKIAGQLINCFDKGIISNPAFTVGKRVTANVEGSGSWLNMKGLTLVSTGNTMVSGNIQVTEEPIGGINSLMHHNSPNPKEEDIQWNIRASWAVNVAATLINGTQQSWEVEQLFDYAEEILDEAHKRNWFVRPTKWS